MSEAEQNKKASAPEAMPPGLDKVAEKKRNLSAVFGHGAGKVAIIAAGAIVVVFLAIGIHGLRKTEPVAKAGEQHFDQATAPVPENEVKPISETEAAKRKMVAGMEADTAAAKGDSYQPPLDPIIEKNKDQGFGAVGSLQPPVPKTDDKQPAQIVLPATTNQPQAQATAGPDQAARDRSLAEAANARDQYIKETRQSVRDQIGRLFGDSQNAGAINGAGGYSQVVYAGASSKDQQASSAARAEQASADIAAAQPKPKALIKTGKIWYATLDSEVNTDDSSDVFATLRSGPFAGAKLIGRVETKPENIQIKFTTLAPLDDRPTMRISAVALREEDAKQGMADEVNHHYLARYTALAAASLLSGAGQAYAYTPGTTILTPTSTQTTSAEPSNKQVAFRAAGALGTAASQEIQRGYNRPTTFKTPANRGFAIFFTEDVMPAQ